MNSVEQDGSSEIMPPVRTREIDSVDQLAKAVQIYNEVFEPEGAVGATVTVELLRVLAKSGNYVGAAFIDEEMVGFGAGIFGPPEAATFHSHVTAVRASAQGRNVGRSIKEHQAAWVRARGVSTITWTFDPLVRRNAHFNLSVLGARVSEYLVNFYGKLDDRVNRGDESDRVLVTWDDTGSASARPVSGRNPAILRRSETGAPSAVPSDEQLVVVEVADDIEALRSTNPETAQAWRLFVRQALTEELRAGAQVVGFTGSGYLLERRRPR